MKRITRIVCALIGILLSLTVLTSCKDSKAPEGTYTRMTMDINPSVEFMIDDQNKVVSVTALNDDGSILIAGEAFVGKTPEEAAEMVVSISGESGYLIKGNVTADENTVKVSVSGDTQYAKNLAGKIEKTVSDKLEKLDIKGTVKQVEAMHTDELRKLAMDTALFTEEEVNGMTEKQLYSAIAAGRVETAILLTEDMREAYLQAKESKISFARSNATATIIDGMGDAYHMVYTGYDFALNAYGSAITKIDDFRYEQLVSPDSEYQIKLQKLRDAKTELLKEKNYVATLNVNGEEYAKASVTLQLSEKNYDSALTAYEELGNQLNASLTSLVETLRKSEAALRSLEDNFSANIKEELQAKADELEASVNAAKDGFFESFENEHKDDIEKTEQSLISQKQKLIDNATAKA